MALAASALGVRVPRARGRQGVVVDRHEAAEVEHRPSPVAHPRVAGDGEEPGRRVRVLREARRVPRQLEEGLLEEVLGDVAAGGKGARETRRCALGTSRRPRRTPRAPRGGAHRPGAARWGRARVPHERARPGSVTTKKSVTGAADGVLTGMRSLYDAVPGRRLVDVLRGPLRPRRPGDARPSTPRARTRSTRAS